MLWCVCRVPSSSPLALSPSLTPSSSSSQLSCSLSRLLPSFSFRFFDFSALGFLSLFYYLGYSLDIDWEWHTHTRSRSPLASVLQFQANKTMMVLRLTTRKIRACLTYPSQTLEMRTRCSSFRASASSSLWVESTISITRLRFTSCYDQFATQEHIFEKDVRPTIDIVYSGVVSPSKVVL